jgi:hypothetical protein
MADDQERRVRQREVDAEYKKPHFGPEETFDRVEDSYKHEQDKKRIVKINLQA